MDIELAYQEALDYLYSFIDYSLTRSLRYTPEKFNLGRMSELMELLGNPQSHYPIIHVAGTKGKGSVSAFCASALREAGYYTGFYSSPHLDQYTERIQINGEQIPRNEFVELVNEIKPFVAKIPALTTFELTTALGFLFFFRRKVDIAVVEVGLGGRLDATNIVTPLVSVITSLSYDHINILGKTLTEIATEKAGIIKPNRPVVLAPQKDEARVVIERIAQERNSQLIQVGKDYLFKPLTHSLDQQTFLIYKPSDQVETISNSTQETTLKEDTVDSAETIHFEIPLLGLHQVENATTAFAALQLARQASLHITEYNVQQGFKKVVWPGRFEVLRQTPPVIIDSAHNRNSAQRLKQALDDYLPDQPVILVFGASEDKDIRGMFSELLPRVKLLIATQSIHPRAMSVDNLEEIAKEFNCQVKSVPKVEDALNLALNLAGKEDAVLVAGSLFVAAAARDIWFNQIVSKE